MQSPRLSRDEEKNSTRNVSDRLDSWKEIASFFGKQVRTVQLWEKTEGLPVLRQHHKKLGSVFAYRSELEAWQMTRSVGWTREANEDRSSSADSRAPVAENDGSGSGMRILALPFETFDQGNEIPGGVRSAERFGQGLQHDLVLELTRSKNHPVVVPFQSIPPQAGSALAWASEMASELEIDLILMGSIRQSGQQLRASMQLIRASDMLCLWSERFDVELDISFASQADLAVKICRSLPHHHVRREKARRSSTVANSGLAFHACSLGFHSWAQRTADALKKAVHYFKDAIELDSSYAEAYAGLADVYISLSYGHLISARTAAPLAWQATRTAYKLNRHSIRVNNAYVNSLIHCNWNLDAAERHCKRMIDSGRLDARTLQLYSSIMILRNRNADSIRWALHASNLGGELDEIPLAGQIALAYFYSGDYENAISIIQKAIEEHPRFVMGYVLLGRAEAQRGKWDHAISAFTKGIELSSGAPFSKALLASAYAGSGDKTQSYAILTKLGTEVSNETFPSYDVSAAYAALNREDEALMFMRNALKNRDMMSIYVGLDPRFSKLRKSLEFQRISSLVYAGAQSRTQCGIGPDTCI